ncbi:uncharacterized protein LOC110010015 [Jatropha curcas]|uniref:uncharacterized protein LOC110010015 n=1 Tax=Jatropha curcas TaxID=180498 RepID=UPI001893CC86|nr:uncharacterized protein LOC110010015 [Jatropha curcas]
MSVGIFTAAVKEYLLIAGYRLTAMTFYEEVIDQNLDVWQNTPAYVPDALRHYYYQYLSSTSQAAEEKIAVLRENESLKKISNFFIGLYFLSVVTKFGISTVYLGFSAICLLAVLYMAGNVVETKGRSLEEIERALNPTS